MVRNISLLEIAVPRAKVWDALTRPDLVKKWQYGSDLITSWNVGDTIRFRTEWQDKVFEQWGKVLEVHYPETLSYTLFAPRPGLEDVPANYFTMRYTLTEAGGKTSLEIAQEDPRAHAVQEEPKGGDNPVLQALRAVAEAL